MIDDLQALVTNQIDQQTFDQRLRIVKQNFHAELRNKVRTMLPNQNIQQIGIG